MKKWLGFLILNYLRILAKVQLSKNLKAIIIGVTGSAGKTSTRKALTHILQTRGKVKSSVKANSESGIPLNILGLSMTNYSLTNWLKVILLAPIQLLTNWEHFDYYIVEMGIDSPNEPKNMSYLLKIIRPDVGVVLNAGLVHGTYFDHLVADRDPVRRAQKITAEIAKEKMKLAHGVRPTGFAVVNFDQKEFVNLSTGIRARLLSFGSKKDARLHLGKVTINKSGFTFKFGYQNQEYTFTLPDYYEESYVYTFSAAIAVGAGLGIAIKDSIAALLSYQAPAGRMRVFAGINDMTIIDSSYNASPNTMENALKLLNKVGGRGKKIAIIGDMRELGSTSKFVHKQLAEWIQKYADQCLLFGYETGEYTQPVLASSKFNSRHFTSIADLIKEALALPQGSTILIKGSQNTIFLERVVEALLANKKDIVKLCRRGEYWDQIRAKTP